MRKPSIPKLPPKIPSTETFGYSERAKKRPKLPPRPPISEQPFRYLSYLFLTPCLASPKKFCGQRPRLVPQGTPSVAGSPGRGLGQGHRGGKHVKFYRIPEAMGVTAASVGSSAALFLLCRPAVHAKTGGYFLDCRLRRTDPVGLTRQGSGFVSYGPIDNILAK